MSETPILFLVEPSLFWQQMKKVIEDVMAEKMGGQLSGKEAEITFQKPLLKLIEVCQIFSVTKPTLYEWIKEGKLRSFKIRNRRYFTREDVEALMSGKSLPESSFFAVK